VDGHAASAGMLNPSLRAPTSSSSSQTQLEVPHHPQHSSYARVSSGALFSGGVGVDDSDNVGGTNRHVIPADTTTILMTKEAPPAGAFFFMGLLNNASYVIMLASAKSISEGGTALVFLSCVIPSLTLKASAPYWFDKVDYRTRLLAASYLMAFAFLWVALFSASSASSSPTTTTTESAADPATASTTTASASAISFRTVGQLLGVAMISLQCGLGEASLLALAGKCDRTSSGSLSSSSSSRHSTSTSDDEELDEHDESARLAAAVAMTTTGATLEPSSLAVHEKKSQKKSKGRCLTYFSSGTGLSGPFGFLWKMLGTRVGLSLSATCCLAAIVLATLYAYIYRSRLESIRLPDDSSGSAGKPPSTGPSSMMASSALDDHDATAVITSPYQDRLDESIRSRSSSPSTRQRFLSSNQQPSIASMQLHAAPFSLEDESNSSSHHDDPHNPEHVPSHWTRTRPSGAASPAVLAIRHMTRSQRFRRVLQLWPYMVPLFTVYAAEYACQAGAWTAIGFPLEDAAARNRFYFASNWLYQLGVFCSRSSGTLLEVSMPVLWVMPGLQVLNLVFFSWAAMHGDGAPYSIANGTGHWWYDETVFHCLAFYAGLLGGAVYVHGYVRIVKDVDPLHTEFALAATSVAESIGILVADLSGLVLQSCIYQAHDIDGALLTCPF
jgi:CLN3 protein